MLGKKNIQQRAKSLRLAGASGIWMESVCTVVIFYVVVAFSLLLIAGEREEERLVNVITDNQCNWADRRRRRERKRKRMIV